VNPASDDRHINEYPVTFPAVVAEYTGKEEGWGPRISAATPALTSILYSLGQVVNTEREFPYFWKT
jgi:hypothetical protein